MAKMVDLKLYNEYERIQKEYNKLRKNLKKKFNVWKEDNTSGRLPSVVIPQRQRKLTQRQAMRMSRRQLRMRIKAMYGFVQKGMKGFFKEFKKSYLELYKTYIIIDDPELNPFGNEKGFLYSQEQIKLQEVSDPKMAQFMRDYNAIVRMNPERFATLIYTGKIPQFHKIYDELVKGKWGFNGYESFAEDLHNAIRLRGVVNESEEDFNKTQKHYEDNEDDTRMRMNYVYIDTQKTRRKRGK